MNAQVLRLSLGKLGFQRNVFAATTFLLAISTVVMSTLLVTKDERIVIVPAVVEESFWVEKDYVSSSYLEQFGVFLGNLLLSKSAASCEQQRSILLRHVDPSFSGQIRKKLVEEEESMKRDRSAYTFYPTQISVDPKKLTILMTGDRDFFADGKRFSQKVETYRLAFSVTNGRLLLKSVEVVDARA